MVRDLLGWCISRVYSRTTLLCNIHSTYMFKVSLSLTGKIFDDDTSVFSIVHDIDSSTKQLKNDLKIDSDWTDLPMENVF